MQSKLFFTCCACAFFLIQSLQMTAQCALSNITISYGWPFTWNSTSNDNDLGWALAPIDTNDDGVADDGFIIAGETETNTSLQIQGLVIRLDTARNIIWSKTYGGTKNDVFYSVKQNADGDLILCGTKKSTKRGSPANSNVWFMELDLVTGDSIADREFGGSGFEDGFDIIEDLSTTPDQYVLAGGTGEHNDYDLDDFTGIHAKGEYWVFAINPANNYQITWQTKYHGEASCADSSWFDWARSILIDHNGKYLVTGYCKSCYTDCEMMQAMLVKIRNDGGQTFWQNDYGDESLSNARDQGSNVAIETVHGSTYGYLCAGVSHPLTCSTKNHDVFGLKTSNTGVNAWADDCTELPQGMGYGGTKKDDGFGVAQTCDGGYLIVGGAASKNIDVDCNLAGSGVFTADLWLLKISSSGAREWDEVLGGVFHDEGHAIQKLWDGSYIVVGELGNGVPNDQDVYVKRFKLNSCTTKVEGNEKVATKNLIVVSPNPTDVSSIISLKIEDRTDQLAFVSVLDPLGNCVYSIKSIVEKGMLKEHLFVNHLPSGLYWISILINDNYYYEKLIVQMQ
jgi:hypothetical protein